VSEMRPLGVVPAPYERIGTVEVPFLTAAGMKKSWSSHMIVIVCSPRTNCALATTARNDRFASYAPTGDRRGERTGTGSIGAER
jgi:hypothetical protein